MKKLMIAASAVALAFGLRADVTALAKEGFAEPGTFTVTGTDECSVSDTEYTCSSLGTIGAPDVWRGNGAGGKNMTVKTPFNAPATFAMAQTPMTGVYLDSMVKFTACDEEPAATDIAGAKIVVWVKEVEDGDTVSQRLMVTAGYLSTVGNFPTLKHYDCGAPADYTITGDTDWCRLTVKAIADISSEDLGVSAFVVFINGKAVGISKDKDIGVAGSAKDSLAWNMIEWEKSHHLFPSMVQEDATLTSVGFAGQGSIDDLAFFTGEPTDVEGTQFAIDHLPSIAKVGTKECKTVEEINNAIAAATEGATVQLLYDIEGDLTFGVGAAFTLDLNGKTLDGGVSAEGEDGCSVNIIGGGKIEGAVVNDREEVITLTSGKIKVSTNEGIEQNVTTAADKMLVKCDDDQYWTVGDREDGTAQYPWLIKTAADLKKIDVSEAAEKQNAKLMGNIALDGVYSIGAINAKNNVGSADYIAAAFKGVFDGQGYTISNVVLPCGDYVGLFGSTYGATIKNLKISLGVAGGFDISEGSYVADYAGAPIVGVSMKTTVENCETLVAGEFDTFITEKAAGGIVGYAGGGTVIKGCVNNLNILSKKNEKAGGIYGCGQDTGATEDSGYGVTIDGCTNNGNVETQAVNKKAIAGLCPYTDSKVTFKGNNVFAGTLTAAGTDVRVQSIICCNGGMIVVEDGATFKVPAAYLAVGAYGGAAVVKAVDGLFFATVQDGVATLVKNADVVAGNSYKVMSVGAPDIVLANEGDTITIDTSLAAVNVTTTAAGCKVEQVGNVYKVVKTAQEVVPGQPVEYDHEPTEQEIANTTPALNQEQASMSADDQAAYKASFEAVKVGSAETGWSVVVKPTAQTVEIVETAVEKAETTILATPGEAAEVTLDAIPGLYYSYATGTTPSLGNESTPVMATGKKVNLAVPAIQGKQGFYQIRVKAVK